jgi:hypothetical protein
MRKILFLILSITMLVLFSTNNSQALLVTPDIGFDPATQDVVLGNPANVDLYFSQVTDLFTLGTFDLDISFDPTILSFSNVTFGDPILGDQLDFGSGFGSIYADIDFGGGLVNLFGLSTDLPTVLDANQAGSFILATLTFDTLALGTSPLGLSVNALGDEWGDPLSADLVSGSINVVPEPATLLLLGSGLAGTGFLGRKRRTKKSLDI